MIAETPGLFEANHVARVILHDAVVSDQFLSLFKFIDCMYLGAVIFMV